MGGKPVSNGAVQEAVAARAHFRCQEAIVVTNNSFTQSARELAASTSVKLIDRGELEKQTDAFNRSPKDYLRLAELMVPREEPAVADSDTVDVTGVSELPPD